MKLSPLLLALLFCSCPSVRVAKGYVIEPWISVEFWDAGDSSLGEDITVGKFGMTLREDGRPVSEVTSHPGFLDRHDAAVAREAEGLAAAEDDHHDDDGETAEAPEGSHTHEGEGASVEGLIDSAERGLGVVENATWAAIGKLIVLLAGLAAIGVGVWYARRWWLTRSSSP